MKLASTLTLSHVVLILSFILGMFFTVFIPPFQKPDEYQHFDKVIAVSQFNFYCTKTYNESIPRAYGEFKEEIKRLQMEFNYGGKFPIKNYLSRPIFSNGYDEQIHNGNMHCMLPPVAYVIPAVTLSIAQAFSFNPFIIFYLVRLSFFSLSFLIILFAYFKAKESIFKFSILVTLLLPMTLHQIGAVSYDSLHIALGLLVVSLYSNYRLEKKTALKQLGTFSIVLILFVSAKSIAYFPFMLLWGLIAYQYIKGRFNTKKIINVIITASLLVCLIATSYGLYYLPSANFSVNTGGGIEFNNPDEQISFILDHPVEYASIILNTIDQLRDFYVFGLFGIYGWTDFQINIYSFVLMIALIAYGFTKVKKDTNLSLLEGGVFLLILFIVVLATFTGLYQYWTPPGYKIVEGVQSRYFLTIVPFLLLILYYILKNVRQKYVVSFIISIVLAFESVGIYRRYYDYSQLFQDTSHPVFDELSPSIEISADTFIEVDTDSQTKIAALVLYPASTSNVTYKYQYSKNDCLSIAGSGYLDLRSQRTGRVIVNLGKVSAERICLSLYPVSSEEKKYLKLYSDNEQPLVTPIKLR